MRVANDGAPVIRRSFTPQKSRRYGLRLVGSASGDRSYAQGSSYSCACGVTYAARRWRWVHVFDRAVLSRVRRDGPFEGACPACGAQPSARAPYVECEDAGATLVLSDDRRGEVLAALRDHLDAVESALVAGTLRQLHSALMRPALRFEGTPAQLTGRARPRSKVGADEAGGGVDPETQPRVKLPAGSAANDGDGSDAGAPEPGVPHAVGSGIMARPEHRKEQTAVSRAGIGELLLADGVVTLHAEVDAEARRMWGTAALRARPIHLRDLGYPVVGVRVIASYLGQVSVIDGVIDVGTDEANAVVHALSKEFKLELVLHSADHSTLPREVDAPGLERNAALCMESARAALAAGEFPPERYATAIDELAARNVADRMAAPAVSLGEGDYRFLVSPKETWLALEHLDEVSAPDNLAELLEVSGFPVTEFEEIRRRVLAASVEHGICAPRRFWRRVVDSGLAEDTKDYIKRLINARIGCQRAAKSDPDTDDLPQAQAREAWQRIYDFCKAKNIAPPKPVLHALGLRVADERGAGKASGNPSMSASGVIGGGAAAAAVARSSARDELGAQLRDPKKRLPAALEVLGESTPDVGDLEELLNRLDGFDADELVTLYPALNETDADPVPGLVAKLMSPSRELRQVAALVLGARRAPAALEPLGELLLRERTAAWHDVARAMGSYGEAALPALEGLLAGLQPKDRAKIDRVARAMAEVAASGDGAHSSVEAQMGQGGLCAVAAERALAMLALVRREGEKLRGVEPFDGANPALEFSRRLHETEHAEEVEDVEVVMVEETQVIRLEDLEMM